MAVTVRFFFLYTGLMVAGLSGAVFGASGTNVSVHPQEAYYQQLLDNPADTPADARFAIQSTPAGTFVHYRGIDILIPGVTLPGSLVSLLVRAGSEVLYRKIIHNLIQLALHQTMHYLSHGLMIRAVYQGLPMALQVWYYTTYLLPKTIQLARHGWEKLETITGTRCRGRMPVFMASELDRAVFVDYLLLTNESGRPESNTLYLTPLRKVRLGQLHSPWQKAMGELVNSALDRGINGIRITIDNGAGIKMEWHDSSRYLFGWRGPVRLYPRASDQQVLLASWLNRDWYRGSLPDNLFTMLATEGLDCIRATVVGAEAVCRPLPAITAVSSADGHRLFLLDDDTDRPTWLSVYGNRTMFPGAPGDITVADRDQIAKHQGSSREYRARSSQYRIPYELGQLAEILFYQLVYKVVDISVNSAIELARSQQAGATIDIFSDGRVQGSVKRVKGADGKTYIRKEADLFNSQTWDTQERYAYLTRDAAVLRYLQQRGYTQSIAGINDFWIENAGSDQAKLVLLLPDGGQSLSSVKVRSQGHLQQLIRGATSALRDVHKAGYVHFDVKPDNFIVNGDGEVRIIDFETASPIGRWSGKAKTAIFDRRWSAPELQSNKPVSAAADIWSLGATALSLMAGSRLPGASTLPNTIAERAPVGRRYIDGVADNIFHRQVPLASPEFTNFLLRTLTPDPDGRFTAEQLLHHPFLMP